MAPDVDDVVPLPPCCVYCAALPALLHCAQHAARLCLPCDHDVHAPAAETRAHERAPLCGCCHAAPAAARCDVHDAFLCAPCARAAGCRGHDRRPARSYTGCPEPAELARILYFDIPAHQLLPLPPPTPALPDLVNVERLAADFSSSRSWSDGTTTMNNELPASSASLDLIQTRGSFEQGHQLVAAALPTTAGDDDGLFSQDCSWPNLYHDAAGGGLDDASLRDFLAQDPNPNLTNSFSFENIESSGFRIQGELECFWAYPLAYQPLNSVGTTANKISSTNMTASLRVPPPPQCEFYNSGMPMWPPDEFPSRHFGVEHLTPAAAPTVVYQDQEAAPQASSAPAVVVVPEQDTEARTKLQEKRQEAKQRYKDKKKHRRFGKQIMYVSRKVRADTRNRVKGRFAKASSSSGGHGDDPSTQHGDWDDQPTHS